MNGAMAPLREAHFMKKALIGTTALVAAGLMSGAAYAADPIKLGLSGNFRAVLGYANQDDGAGQIGANRRDFGIGHDSKINFTGKTTLDNGIEVGVAIELEPESDARGNTNVAGGTNRATLGEVDIIDEAYIYLENQQVWGRIELGDRDGASNKMNTLGPFVLGTSIVGVATIQAVTAPAGNQASVPILAPGSRGTLAGDSTKITYYTPRFAGFQLGASYTPDRVENQGRFAIGLAAIDTSTLAADAAQGDIMDISANYVMTFGKVGVRANMGYTKGDQESTAVGTFDEDEFVVGGQVSFGAFAFGGSYLRGDVNVNTGGAANRKEDETILRLAGTYAIGAWLTGLEYAKKSVDQTAGGEDEVTIWGLAARRTLGGGVTIGAGIRRWDWEDSTGAAAAENEATEVVVETSFTF
jgi:outer membrane protein OmpU